MNECIHNKIKEILLHKISASGKYITPIPGLTLLCGKKGIKSLSTNNILSIVLVIQGNGFVIYKDKNTIYHENDYFITIPQIISKHYCITNCESKHFLAFSLKISRHVLSLLGTEDYHVCFQHAGTRDDTYEEDIKIDLFNCFQRLIMLMDKPKQIHVRAPIIICEIHYLVLISRKWRDCEPAVLDDSYMLTPPE